MRVAHARLRGPVGPFAGVPQGSGGGLEAPAPGPFSSSEHSIAARGNRFRKSLFWLLPIIALPLGEAAHSEYSAAGPSFLLSQNTSQTLPSSSTQPDDATANPVPSTVPVPDWMPPSSLPFSATQNLESGAVTDGTASKADVGWHASADTSGTESLGQEDDLPPRVDLAGPGAPKWKVITSIAQTTTIDDNLFISHSNKQSDLYFSVTPGIAAGWGDFRTALLQNSTGFSDEYEQTGIPVEEEDPTTGEYAFIDYTADASHYLSHDSLDAVDQDAGITAQWDLPKVVLGLNARAQSLSGPEIDLGMRTRRTIFTVAATAAYTLSDKTSFDLDAEGVARDYASELSSSEWHAQFGINYQWLPKTNIGAAIVVGLRELESNPDQYYQQGLLHATYDATDRLSLRINGGIEVDETSGGGSTQISPVFGLGADYNIDLQDTLSVNASQTTSSSPITSGEDTETTSADLELHHRLSSSFSIGLSMGYQHVQYYTQGLSNLVRTDNYLYLRPSIAFSFAQWSQVELAYEYHRDVSSQQSFDFGENIASLQFDFVF